MILRRIICAVCIFASFGAAQCQAQQSTGDSISKGDDPRLEQKITLSADGLAISEVVAQLSESAGIKLSAGLNDQDWAVRDRKVIIQVTDMKLADLMRHLASTLRFRWSSGLENGKPTYRLWQDKNARIEEESLRADQDSEQSAQARGKRENALADMVNLGSLSRADADKLKNSDPWRYVLATEPLGRDVADLMTNFSDARGAFVQGTEVGFPVAELPVELQSTVRRIADSYNSLMRSIGDSEDHSALLAKFDKLQITINRRDTKSDILSKDMLGRITIGSGVDSFDIPLFEPSSLMGNALGKAIISLKSGKSKDEVGAQLRGDMLIAANKAQEQKAPTRDITSDPELRARFKLFGASTTATLPVILKTLANAPVQIGPDKVKFNVVSDCFPGGAPAIDSVERTLGEQLEMISNTYGSNWTKAGRVLLFRDKDWFSKRAWAVPEVWLKYWTERAKLNNGLLIEDMAQIADLRDEQLDNTIMTDPMMIRFGAGESARNRHILRLYAALTSAQRTEMAQSKLDVQKLNEEQWELLKAALATKGAAYAAAQMDSQFLRFTQSAPDAVELSYTITYYPNDTDPGVPFKLASGIIITGFSEKSKEVAPTRKE